MKTLFRSFCLLACASSLSSCGAVSQRGGSLLNAPFQMGNRMLEAFGRTLGMGGIVNADVPAAPTSEPEAVAERARMIREQGGYGTPSTAPERTRVATR